MVKLSLILALLFLASNSYACPFKLDRELYQGGIAYGKIDEGYDLFLDKKKIPTKNGNFIIGIHRDRKVNALFKAFDNKTKKQINCEIEVKKFKWKIDYVNGVEGEKVTPPKSYFDRIQKEQNLMVNARKALLTNHFPTSFIMPVHGRISSPFGGQRVFNGQPRSPHSGIDIAAKQGTPIKAIEDGKVMLAYDEMFFSGKIIVIDHGFYVNSTYAHLSKINVKKGDTVKKGDIIGEVGSTGRSTGPHLHITINIFGVNVDPLKVLKD